MHGYLARFSHSRNLIRTTAAFCASIICFLNSTKSNSAGDMAAQSVIVAQLCAAPLQASAPKHSSLNRRATSLRDQPRCLGVLSKICCNSFWSFTKAKVVVDKKNAFRSLMRAQRPGWRWLNECMLLPPFVAFFCRVSRGFLTAGCLICRPCTCQGDYDDVRRKISQFLISCSLVPGLCRRRRHRAHPTPC